MIFVDSNVPMYVAGREHPHREPAGGFLESARAGQVDICTAIHAGVMLNHGLSEIATFDEGFDAIGGISRVVLR